MWRAFMDRALAKMPNNEFETPLIEDKSTLKPVLKGIWQGGIQEGNMVVGGVHTILKWVKKDDPRGDYPENPYSDPQFQRWEYGVRIWAENNGFISDLPYRPNI